MNETDYDSTGANGTIRPDGTINYTRQLPEGEAYDPRYIKMRRVLADQNYRPRKGVGGRPKGSKNKNGTRMMDARPMQMNYEDWKVIHICADCARVPTYVFVHQIAEALKAANPGIFTPVQMPEFEGIEMDIEED